MKRLLTVIAAAVLAWGCVLPCQGAWILDGQPVAPEGGGAPAGGGTNIVVAADEGTFPVFRLELGGQWTDFELKASTNNFTNLVYYILSSGTNGTADDTNLWVYFTDDYGADVRQWRRSAAATAIGGQVADAVNSEVEAVIVCPSHECAVPWAGWMAQTNNRLVWSYVRYDGIGWEMNATGTKTHWSPVVPVEWRRERIAP